MKRKKLYIINHKNYTDCNITNNPLILFKLNKEKLELTKSLIKIYADLYDYSRNGYIKPKFSKKKIDYSFGQKYLNICICSIAKNENLLSKTRN